MKNNVNVNLALMSIVRKCLKSIYAATMVTKTVHNIRILVLITVIPNPDF